GRRRFQKSAKPNRTLWGRLLTGEQVRVDKWLGECIRIRKRCNKQSSCRFSNARRDARGRQVRSYYGCCLWDRFGSRSTASMWLCMPSRQVRSIFWLQEYPDEPPVPRTRLLRQCQPQHLQTQHLPNWSDRARLTTRMPMQLSRPETTR